MRSLLDEPLRFGSITAAAASQVALQRGVWGRQPVSRLEAPVVRSLSVPKKVLDQHWSLFDRAEGGWRGK